jgi:hypothetical protein
VTEKKIVKPLDPTRWRRVCSWYEQQGGAAQLLPLKRGTKITGWKLLINYNFRGSWPKLAQAKACAFELTGGHASKEAK